PTAQHALLPARHARGEALGVERAGRVLGPGAGGAEHTAQQRSAGRQLQRLRVSRGSRGTADRAQPWAGGAVLTRGISLRTRTPPTPCADSGSVLEILCPAPSRRSWPGPRRRTRNHGKGVHSGAPPARRPEPQSRRRGADPLVGATGARAGSASHPPSAAG